MGQELLRDSPWCSSTWVSVLWARLMNLRLGVALFMCIWWNICLDFFFKFSQGTYSLMTNALIFFSSNFLGSVWRNYLAFRGSHISCSLVYCPLPPFPLFYSWPLTIDCRAAYKKYTSFVHGSSLSLSSEWFTFCIFLTVMRCDIILNKTGIFTR